jgi:hypothetical protein
VALNIVRSSIVRAWLCTLALVPSALAAEATAPTGQRGRSMNEMLAEADSALRARGGSHAEHAQLYLSWNAPYGMPRASSQRAPVCGDTTAVDTLYLSFLPGRTTDSFTGFSAELRFHATGGDTLGPFWHMEGKGGANPGNLQVEFGPSETIPGVQPWTVAGQGLAFLDHTPDAMRLRTIFAVAFEQRSHVDSARVYTLCRILVRHRRTATLAGCEQPVCVEWASARFGFALKDEPEVRRGERFVVWGRDATACDASRGPRAPVWRPGARRPR